MFSVTNICNWDCQYYGERRFTGCIRRRFVHTLLYHGKIILNICLGCALSWDGKFAENIEGEVFPSVVSHFLDCACFVYIGAWIPFNAFNLSDLDIDPWRLALLACGIIFLRRIPALLVLYTWIPGIASWRQALFSGHFGTCVAGTGVRLI